MLKLPHLSPTQIISIDQTGRSKKNFTTAAPLKGFYAQKKKTGEWSGCCLQLESLNLNELRKHCQMGPKTWIIVDCVFGLPKKSRLPDDLALFELLSLTKNMESFGRLSAYKFFSQFLRKNQKPPRRLCEKLAKANSIFQYQPFQKNIQTGSFRIWKDLAHHKKQPFNFWPFDKMRKPPLAPLSQAWIFEIYPSFFWKEFFKFSSRKPSEALTALESLKSNLSLTKKDESLIKKDNDYADAYIGALGLLKILENKKQFSFAPPKGSQIDKEGWILGLKPPATPTDSTK